jgi:long-chain acyl-CoA synthetase
MSIRTLAELFMVVAGHQKPDLLLVKREGQFRPIPTSEVVDAVRRLAQAMQKAGLGAGDRVALMADNGPHWPIIDFATLTSGGVTVPIYPTLLPEQSSYIVNDSGAKLVFVHTNEQLEGLLAHRDELPQLEKLILIEGEPASGNDVVTTLEAFAATAGEVDVEAFGDRAHSVQPDQLASLVYTSGTTGKPKGVMLTHGNFVSNLLTGAELFTFDHTKTALSFLPLSHVFERTVDYCYFYRGCSIAYAESVQAVAQNLGEVKPHFFVSVPRVYEKVLAKVYDNVEKGSPIKRRIFEWATGVAREALPWRLRHESPPGLLGLQLALADRLVFGKIRERLGGRFEFAISGGAPLGRDVAEFFWGAGVHVYEGYGLTETSPVIAANFPRHTKLGTVGQVIDDCEVKFADDGEIVVRGPNIMKGYFNLPEATAEALDDDGFFHTGDIGHLDDEGYLVITDRKKEIIVNAYGKNIAPAPIENLLKASRYISQAVVIGDRRKFLSALLVPDFEALASWAAQQGLEAGEPEALVEQEAVKELFQGELEKVNEELAHYEEIQKFELIPREFTLEGGELTPTQKVKRRVINDKYGSLIDGIYTAARDED